MVIPRQSVLDGIAHLPQWIAQVSNVTGSRALATNYQNTTGRPVLCLVTCSCNAIANGDTAFATALVGSISPPNVTIARNGITGGPIRAMYAFVAFAVPANHYYKVNGDVTATGTVSLTHWMEVTL